MRSGITRQALRRHRWAFLGPVTTQLAGAAIITTMLTTNASVHTAAQRAAVGDMVTVFVGISVYLSILLVGVTITAAITRQRHDIALLRAVGATPGQIRRSIVLQALCVAGPAAAAGWLLGLAGGRAFTGALLDHGVLPGPVHSSPHLWTLPVVLGIALGTSVPGALIAAIRPSRVRPAVALTDAGLSRRRGLAVRAVIGVLLFTGGAVLSVIIATRAPEQGADLGFFVILAMCVGVGFLGPAVLRGAVLLGRPLFRLAGGTGALAGDGLVSMSRQLSGAMIPLVLAIAFAAVKVAVHTTAARVTGSTGEPGEVWTDAAGTTIYCVFAAIAALNTLITVTVGRKRDFAVLRLAGATRRRVFAVVVCEAGTVLFVALVLAAAVALATLVPLLRAELHVSVPSVPPADLLAGVLLAALVVLGGTLGPAIALTRRPAIEAVS